MPSQEIKEMVKAAWKVVLAEEALKKAEREHDKLVEDHVNRMVTR